MTLIKLFSHSSDSLQKRKRGNDYTHFNAMI